LLGGQKTIQSVMATVSLNPA